MILVEPLLRKKGMVSLNTLIGFSLIQRGTPRCRRSQEKTLSVNLGFI